MPDTTDSRTTRYRSIWVSDVHLGTRDCQDERFLQFLQRYETDNLYLVGDIFDGWALRRSWYWKQSYNDILSTLLRKSRRGTNVVYIPGNHDEFARDFLYLGFAGIVLRDRFVHTTARGERYLVLHGDQFDGVIRYARWLAVIGAHAYQLLLYMNRWVNYWRSRFGRPYWSLSAHLKHKSKKATQFISRFENAVSTEARRAGVDGVICGHIHHAELRHIEGIHYANSGDWVESCTALTEDHNGTLRILRYTEEDCGGRYHEAAIGRPSGDGAVVGQEPDLASRDLSTVDLSTVELSSMDRSNVELSSVDGAPADGPPADALHVAPSRPPSMRNGASPR